MGRSRSDALDILRLLHWQLVALGDCSAITKKTRYRWSPVDHGAANRGERYLGLPLNSSRSPNFGSWELKVVPVRRLPDGTIKVKETMAITMIDPTEVAAKDFRDSHLFLKLQRMIVVARVFESQAETRSLCRMVAEFDLGDSDLYGQVRADYDLVRDVIRRRGFHHLSGSMGVVVQPRTKGPGHGSTSRAFYARARLVARILGIIPA